MKAINLHYKFLRKKFQSLYYVNPVVSHLCIPETWSQKTIRLSRARCEKPIQCWIWSVPRTLINILENLLKSFKNPHKKLHHRCWMVSKMRLCEWRGFVRILLRKKLRIPVQYCISYRNQSFDLHCKSNDWFLYEMQHWPKIG